MKEKEEEKPDVKKMLSVANAVIAARETSAAITARDTLNQAAEVAKDLIRQAAEDARLLLHAQKNLDSTDKMSVAIKNHGQLSVAQKVLQVAATTAENLVAKAAEEAQMKEKLEANEWKLDKKFTIGIMASLVLQTFAIGWFISNLSSKVDGLIANQAQVSTLYYTKDEAKHDIELLESRTATAKAEATIENNSHLTEMKEKVEDLYQRLDNLSKK